RRVRGAGRGDPADRAPRAREADADGPADAYQGAARADLRRSRPRRQAARSRGAGYRSPARVVAGARDRHGTLPASPGQRIHRRRAVAAFADGGEPRQVRRVGRRMDASRRGRLLTHPGAARNAAHASRRMTLMRSVVVDKIASVALGCDLAREIRIDSKIPCEEGVLIAVEVLNSKSSYNVLELTSGRMAQVKRGDVIVGALGHRKALFGYSGHLPEKLVPGDVVQLLNLGGVLGICDSVNPTHGQPFDCRVLGVVLDFPYLGQRVGAPARVGKLKLNGDSGPVALNGVPVVALAGTCMNSGKTAAACAIVSRFRHEGLVVDAFKATGVALRRDILAME